MKSVQIRSYFWSVFSCIRTEYLSVFSPNAEKYGLDTEKYGPEITPYLDTFHAVKAISTIRLGHCATDLLDWGPNDFIIKSFKKEKTCAYVYTS